MLATDKPSWVTEKERRVEKARSPFEAIRGYLGIDYGDWTNRRRGAAVFRRVTDAVSAVREWRYANNQSLQDHELEIVAIRVSADQFAREIEDAAGGTELDAATISWVLAGLRCSRRPFCTGCLTCFTVTSPHRPND